MAESVTYADLRFVKSPLKSLSARLEQDAEVDDDGELTYENVQVPSAKDVFSSPAQPDLGEQTGREKTEKTITTLFSETPPTPRRILPYPVAWIPYILPESAGHLFAVGCHQHQPGYSIVIAASLPTAIVVFPDMQVSHQLRNANQVLEATNGSLWQQLQMETDKLSSKEDDLQAKEEKLAQTQQHLQVEKEQHQDAQKNLLACRSEQDKTQQSLADEKEERRLLEDKLRNLQDGLKQVQLLFKCSFPDQEWIRAHSFPRYCCPLAWELNQRKCLYFSIRKKTWSESDSFCKSISSKLLVVTSEKKQFINSLLTGGKSHEVFWAQSEYAKNQNGQDCQVLGKYSYYHTSFDSCEKMNRFICEKEAVTSPVELRDPLLH